MTFEGFNDGKCPLSRCHFFEMLGGTNLSAMLPKSWKKSFNNGILIPTRMR